MAVRGFNVFAIGANGARIQAAVRTLLEEAAGKRPQPSDWVYVNNFATPYRPVAIDLPAGRAPALEKSLDHLIDDLKVSLPAAFESEDYQKRRTGIEQEIRGRNERAFTALRERPAGEVRPHLERVVRAGEHTTANRLLATSLFLQGLDRDGEARLLAAADAAEDGPVLAELLRAVGKRRVAAAAPLLARV